MSGLYPPVETAYYAVSILHRNYCCAMWLLSRRRHGYCIMAVIETATWLLHYGCYRDGDMAIALWLLSRRIAMWLLSRRHTMPSLRVG